MELDIKLLQKYSKAEVSAETLRSIENLNKNNIDFTVVLARSVKSMQIFFAKTTHAANKIVAQKI